jgi:hypothetical protein
VRRARNRDQRPLWPRPGVDCFPFGRPNAPIALSTSFAVRCSTGSTRCRRRRRTPSASRSSFTAATRRTGSWSASRRCHCSRRAPRDQPLVFVYRLERQRPVDLGRCGPFHCSMNTQRCRIICIASVGQQRSVRSLIPCHIRWCGDPRGEQLERVMQRKTRFGRIDLETLLGVSSQLERASKFRVTSPATGWWSRLVPARSNLTLWSAQRRRNSSLRVERSSIRSVSRCRTDHALLRRGGRRRRRRRSSASRRRARSPVD